ncbi:iron-siderophore ABC transporter substrate-binding protein [Rhodococcus erythropolis]|uniref:iron-siderophore ABC transporter substrate-binding protein n=1 Tax=Rhodococcus erythropolis TaxID=1833 RepID=UPI0040417713
MHVPSRSTRILAALFTTAAIIGFSTACGTSQGVDTASATQSNDAFPVTIEHAQGSTTIDAEPQRVVTLGYTDHEPLLALGVEPVGMAEWWGSGMDESWPWTKNYWKGKTPTYINSGGDFNFEQIASLAPDLILALYADIDTETYKKLTSIAPTVAQSKDYDAYTTPWTDMTLTAGRALGKEPQAQQLISDTENAFATARAAHPEFSGQTATIVNLDTPEGYVFSSHDPRGIFLSSLGFTLPPTVDAFVGDQFGDWLPNERYDILEPVDRLIVMADPEGEKALPGNTLYQRLPAVKNGNAIVVRYTADPPVGAAMSGNTVLSIPYAIDQLTATLSK